MSITVIGKHEKDKRACRDAYVQAMAELMEADQTVVHVDTDLKACINTKKLDQYGRCINAGIAEANAMGLAAGLTAAGKKTWIHSFGCFSSRRAFDQAFMSAAYAKLGVKVLGSDPGVCAAYNGGTHMPFEDCALYLSVPDAIVIDPTDYAMVYDLTKKLTAVEEKLSYMRMIRKGVVQVYADGSEFEIGKGVTLKESDHDAVTVIASGIMVDEALKAYEKLLEEGITVRVIDMFTWKPIDEELIVKAATETGAIVTAENHNCTCGLGSAVARVLSAQCPTPVEMVGVHDQFGQVGAQNFLQEAYKLTAEEIICNVKKVLERK